MISTAELASTARARLIDAEVLSAAGRYDSAIYLCGYAVELQLKAAICRTIGWADFPSSSREFEKLRSFKTHDLTALLHLTNREQEVINRYSNEWEEVETWNPELRYNPPGTVDESKAHRMLAAATTIVGFL
ncbi:MAG TPA: HEPN domain-containing protein [Longimicrobium sp.]